MSAVADNAIIFLTDQRDAPDLRHRTRFLDSQKAPRKLISPR